MQTLPKSDLRLYALFAHASESCDNRYSLHLIKRQNFFKYFWFIGAGPAGLATAKALKQYPNLSATIFEAKSILGGLWAVSEDRTSDSKSTGANCPPQLRTNLSQFKCSFSDLSWRTSTLSRRLFPKSYEVQQYLQEYASLSKGIFRFNTKVARVEHKSRPDQSLWKVSFLQDGGEETSEDFDFVIVASGFFARPWIPQSLLPFSSYNPKVAMQAPRILHSSEYAFDRVLSFFPSANTDHLPRKRKVVVVGGSLSAVEVISDLCINSNSIRSEASSAEKEKARPNFWEVIHVVPRPFWILPRFLPHLKRTSSDTSSTSPKKFLPLDLILYDASKLRMSPASRSNTPPSEAERFYQSNTNLRTLLGYTSHAQADLSPNLEITEENGWMYCPPWVTISDTYANFMREKKAEIVVGHVTGADIANDSRITLTLTSNSRVETITEVDVVISCTGYKPSLEKFLSPEVLRAMEYSTASSSSSDVTFLPAILPQQMFLPCSTDLPHNATTTIGFVGMYKGPYFGVIELQARYLAALFARELEWPKQETLSKDAEAMRSIRRSREKGRQREDGSRERKQWSWGDYMGVVKDLAERLGVVEGSPFSTSSSESEIDPIIPAYFSGQNTSQDALKSIHALKEALDSSFLSVSVFRALHGSWKVHRRIVSHLADVPGGVFEGTANFLPRCISGDRPHAPNEGTAHGYEYEYLYSEIGTFTLSNNPDIKLDAKKKYVYRYEEDREVISVWFVKGDGWTTDELFHEVTDFDGTVAPTTTSRSASVCASGTRHLCGPDTYNTTYHFSFLNSGPELESLSIRYKVEGPKKNYISEATYERLAGL